MIRSGKVVQIILNKDLNKYLFYEWIYKQLKATGKDLVVLKNPEYPAGIRGYFLSFKKNKPEDVFPILMNASGIIIGQELTVNVEKFKVETSFYEDKK